MFDIIFKPLQVLFDNKKKLPNRIFYFSAIVVSLFLINDYTGFLRNYKTNSELNQIQKLRELGVNDSILTNRINSLTAEVLNQKSTVENLISLFFSTNPSTDEESKNTNKIFNLRNYSASFLFANLMIVLIIIPFFNFGKEKGKWLELLLGISFMEIIFGIMAWIMIRLLGMIPDFSNTLWNIVLNFSINFILIAFLVIGIISSKRKQNT